MPGTAEAALRARVGAELDRPAPAAAQALCEAIRARHGDAVAAVVFYGSCLRKGTHEGVLDFYVLVDRYRDAYERRWLAAANAALPPNVFYLETQALLEPGTAPATVRCKYAVVSLRGFEKRVSPAALHPYIWARFAQPALLVYARDEAARARVVGAAAQAVITLVRRLAPFMPARGPVQRFRLAALWQEALRRTYGTELRSESAASIRAHYDANPERYDEVARLALAHLQETGWIEALSCFSGAAEVYQPPRRRRAARLRWHLTWPVARALAVARLLKTALTFGDWVPYALWKVERHSGVRPELSERQRRHPLIFGWPVIVRLLRSGALR